MVDVTVNGEAIKLHLSHALPLYKAAYPFYDTGLGRLCAFTRAADGRLDLVDVGANVGDGLLQVPRDTNVRVLCIEGDARYFPLLLMNSASRAGVTCVQAICDETERTTTDALVHEAGTSRLAAAPAGARLRHTTVDRIVGAHTDFRPNVLKVDTDGYDYRVLRGAGALLARESPILFFELSPPHLLAVGEDPLAVFPFLAESGYHHLAFYDHLGRLTVRTDVGARDTLESIVRYARVQRDFYYDVIAFPAARAADWARFRDAEVACFDGATGASPRQAAH